MQVQRPRFVLFADSDFTAEAPQWRFALHATDSDWTIAACDRELGASEDRLALLALVRGLEALDQPSDVTLVTNSNSVARGVTRDLSDWRNNHWRWERFGRLTPVRDADLWRRVDQAFQFHQVSCRTWRFDRPMDNDRVAQTEEPPRVQVAAAGDEKNSFGQARFVDGMIDSPTMVIVPSGRSKRRVRLAPQRQVLAAG